MDYFYEHPRRPKQHKVWNPPYTTAHPDIHVHPLDDSDRFIVLATDGLFDFLSSQEVVDTVAEWMHHQQDPDTKYPELKGLNASSALIRKALAKASRRKVVTVENNLADDLSRILQVPQEAKREFILSSVLFLLLLLFFLFFSLFPILDLLTFVLVSDAESFQNSQTKVSFFLSFFPSFCFALLSGGVHDDTTVAVIFFDTPKPLPDFPEPPEEAAEETVVNEEVERIKQLVQKWDDEREAALRAQGPPVRFPRNSILPPPPPVYPGIDGKQELVDAPKRNFDIRKPVKVPGILSYHDFLMGKDTAKYSVGGKEFRAEPAEYGEAW